MRYHGYKVELITTEQHSDAKQKCVLPKTEQVLKTNSGTESANRNQLLLGLTIHDTVVQQGTRGLGSRLVLAFTGPAWSLGPTSVGL